MAKAAKRKPVQKKPVAKSVARRKPTPKPKQPAQRATRRKPMADKDYAPPPPAPKPAAKEPLAGGIAGGYSATTVSVPPADLLTEQEKDTSSALPGVGPVEATVTEVVPVETIEDLGIGPREPYPSGGAPAADATKKKEVKK